MPQKICKALLQKKINQSTGSFKECNHIFNALCTNEKSYET